MKRRTRVLIACAALGSLFSVSSLAARQGESWNNWMQHLRSAAERGDVYAKLIRCGSYSRGELVADEGKQALEHCTQLAQQGSAPAAMALSQVFLVGNSEVKQDPGQAAKWMQIAATKSYLPAMFNLGVLYKLGQGVGQSDEEALRWFRLAADRGFPEAKYAVGRILTAEPFGSVKFAEGLRYVEDASLAGNSKALSLLVALDKKALERVEDRDPLYESALRGNPQAQFEFAKKLADGTLEARRSASLWLLRAAIVGNHGMAAFELGKMYLENASDPGQAQLGAQLLELAAQRNITDAKLEYGRRFISSIYQSVVNKSLSLLQEAAEEGNPYAKAELGILLYRGEKIERNESLSRALLEEAASKGVTDAQQYLGLIYYEGWGVDKSVKDAEKWFRSSASVNSVSAEMLGVMAEQGELGPKRFSDAIAWYRKSVALGGVSARIRLAKLLLAEADTKSSVSEVHNLLEEAAREGSIEARYILAKLYFEGVGVKVNVTHAYMWANLAASVYPRNQSSDAAVALRTQIGQRLSEKERKAAILSSLKWAGKLK